MNVPMGFEVIRSKHDPTRFWVAVVMSGSPDRFPGCYWNLYNADSSIESYGSSKGWSGDGAGSALSAMRLARAAARRRDKPPANACANCGQARELHLQDGGDNARWCRTSNTTFRAVGTAP